MAWFSGRVSLGNLEFPDLAGAVNKISESVKNIEKNFDTALGYEGKSESEDASEVEETESSKLLSSFEEKEGSPSHSPRVSPTEKITPREELDGDRVLDATERTNILFAEGESAVSVESHDLERVDDGVSEPNSESTSGKLLEMNAEQTDETNHVDHLHQIEASSEELSENKNLEEARPGTDEVNQVEDSALVTPESHNVTGFSENVNSQKEEERVEDNISVPAEDAVSISQAGTESEISATPEQADSPKAHSTDNLAAEKQPEDSSETVFQSASHETDGTATTVKLNEEVSDHEPDIKVLVRSSRLPDTANSVAELDKLRKEMKMMETAVQGAARQAQAKADEIAKLMNENEHLTSIIDDLRRKSNEAEVESLREEYHQRVATLERKLYALTKERDTLRREQNRKSDAAALLKEKDEIITQVMAEGEELSKKQAAQEAQIRKLRAQVRELEEEKKALGTKLQVEENKVESIKRDKAETESLLQETIENHQAELAAQKEFYTNALNAAKEAEALAESRANDEARTELESRLREAGERENMLVQALEELRQTLSRKEQEAVFREDMLRREVEDLQKRYQASERRCEELVTQVPESTRPLLRQIEAMQETTARRAEAWAAVERSLNSRLQEAEARAASAEERERSINERLSQTLSRVNVLEAQISCLRAEQTQLSRSLEKERQRASENRQEYLAAKEEADTHEGRVSQLEETVRELRKKHKEELQEALMQRELLQQEVDKEKAARLELEKTARLQASTASADQSPLAKQKSGFENGNLIRKLSSASSLSSMEESFFLQASLDSSDTLSERRNPGEMSMSPHFLKSMTPSAFEATLRQKEGELASYMSRLASMESIRDSLAEELVKMTEHCEKLRVEAATLPGVRAELEALRRRHSAALELMGERDEELEELRADIVDLKEMYREQVNLLVNKIQVMNPSLGAS